MRGPKRGPRPARGPTASRSQANARATPGRKLSSELNDAVQETRLLLVANGVGLAKRRDGEQLDIALLVEQREGGGDRLSGRAEVRTDPNVNTIAVDRGHPRRSRHLGPLANRMLIFFGFARGTGLFRPFLYIVLRRRASPGSRSRRYSSRGEGGARMGWDHRRPAVGAKPVTEASVRIFDFVTALFLLFLLIPLIVLISIGILIDSRGPILYGATRVGRYGQTFRMLKFRKMTAQAQGPPLTVARDARFTRLDGFSRRRSWMSCPSCGTSSGANQPGRPSSEDIAFVSLLRDDYEEILTVPPGITGLSQLAFAKESQLLASNDSEDYYVESCFRRKWGSTASTLGGDHCSSTCRSCCGPES